MDTQEGSLQARLERIRRIAEVLGQEGIAVDPEAVARAYEIAGERLQALWNTHCDMGSHDQVGLLLDILQAGGRIPRPGSLMDRLVEAYTTPILSALPVPLEGAHSVPAELAARGLRLGIICNTGRTPGKILRIILERLNLTKYFSAMTFSDEVGVRKPRREIFERTLAALGVEPQAALHVGDSPESDVVGARCIGMRAVHICHARGADKQPQEGETIVALPELLSLIEAAE